ncbi:MAG: hypothetical protein GY847_18270 [Proteobacteria bacterium]|nr:hypothetical protein [Pseudomonadota bacterium]
MKKTKQTVLGIVAVLISTTYLLCSDETNIPDKQDSDLDSNSDTESDADTGSDTDLDTDTNTDSNSNSDVCNSLVATGHTLGKVPDNLTLLDADGNPHSLWDHCGDVIIFEYGCMW